MKKPKLKAHHNHIEKRRNWKINGQAEYMGVNMSSPPPTFSICADFPTGRKRLKDGLLHEL